MYKKKGFTLTELLGIIVILAILVGLAVFGVSKYTKYTKDKRLDYIVKTLTDAAAMKYNAESSKLAFNVKELVSSKNDLKSPYGGFISGFIFAKCVDGACKFIPCIDANNDEKMTISYNNASVLCTTNGAVVSDYDFEAEEQRQENFEKKYGYRIVNIYDTDDPNKELDEEDLYYNGENYAVRDDKWVKIEPGKNVYQNVIYKGGYYRDKKKTKWKAVDYDAIVLANDGEKATVFLLEGSTTIYNKYIFASSTPGVYGSLITAAISGVKSKVLEDDTVRILDVDDLKAMSYQVGDSEFSGNSYLAWTESPVHDNSDGNYGEGYWIQDDIHPFTEVSKDSEEFNKCKFILRQTKDGVDKFILKTSKCSVERKVAFVVETSIKNIVPKTEEIDIIDEVEDSGEDVE